MKETRDSILLVHVTKHHAWNRTTVCWLVLTAYLYIQFESYAFYALWLLVFAVGSGCLSVRRKVDDIAINTTQ
jgi:hypothetical protein